jgi:hypothetical protein
MLTLTVFLREPSQYRLDDLLHSWPRATLWEPVDGGTCDNGHEGAASAHGMNGLQILCGQCNATHVVTYVAGTAAQERAIRPAFVVFDTGYVVGRRESKNGLAVSNRSHSILWMREPPQHIKFAEVTASHGFAGYVSFQRNADVFAPLGSAEDMAIDFLLSSAARATTQQQQQQQRTSIGIWHNNCGSTWRHPIIDTLLGSGLDVRSYGRCKNNVPFRGEHPPTLDDERGQWLCPGHRLMLAVENFACTDWISPNLQHALWCGAIPIVAMSGGLPDYDAIVGELPRIDAGQVRCLELT